MTTYSRCFAGLDRLLDGVPKPERRATPPPVVSYADLKFDRWCPNCKQWLPRDRFGRKGSGYRAWCRTCAEGKESR
jgi:hypothetical protein